MLRVHRPTPKDERFTLRLCASDRAVWEAEAQGVGVPISALIRAAMEEAIRQLREAREAAEEGRND